VSERKRAAKVPVLKLRDGEEAQRAWDAVAAEEPMEIRVNGEAVSVTMRTPGHDFELALGFCLSEGIVDRPDAVETMRYCAGDDPATGLNTYNVVDLHLRVPGAVAPDLKRNVYTTSSCGICGTASIEAVRKRLPALDDDLRVTPGLLSALPGALRAAQEVFDRTGGLHAAGLFDAKGTLRCVREDVGRHNAVDKVIGWAATQGELPLAGHLLLVSGRVAFEIAQKALYARIPLLAAVSAPSSLAVDLARDSGMTLVGFLRDGRMNIYAGEQRVDNA
jgi:FdhD protein